MRQSGRVATDAARHTPGFVKLFDHEIACLVTLPGWMLRLFLHLIELTNYRTGAGSTRLATLVQLMTPIQPASGPKHYVPDAQAVRKAILAFERSLILARDKSRSEREGLLFFLVSPRGVQVRPRPELEGGTRRGVDKRRASIHAA